MRGWFFLSAALIGIATPPALASNEIYNAAAPSTVWFYERGSATGVLVDAEKKWVLTAEHVVRDNLREGKIQVKVIFAQTDKQGNVLVEKAAYGFEKKKQLGIN